MKMLLVALIGALAAVLANRGIAVFNDGLRPIMPEVTEGRMDRKALAATSFALCFGLVIGFGIPVSLTASILLIHSVLLGTDIIGTWSPSGKLGTAVAAVIGALYGIGLLLGLSGIVDAFKMLPVNFLPQMAQVGAPVVAAFAAFPALVVGYQYGVKHGLVTLAAIMLTGQVITVVNPVKLGGALVTINPIGAALAVGMLVLLVYAVRERPGEAATRFDLASVFSERVARIKQNLPILAVMGALIAAATNMHLMAGDPISLNLLAKGQVTEAALAALARGLGFLPLVAGTAIATGVYGPVGATFIFSAALFSPNPVVAAVLGAVIIAVEVYFLDTIARFFDRFPGMRKAGDNIRTAIGKVLEIALLIGGMNAAHAIAPGFGLLVVAGGYILNEMAGAPVVRMAVGPVGAIAVGILANILKLLGLFVAPTK